MVLVWVTREEIDGTEKQSLDGAGHRLDSSAFGKRMRFTRIHALRHLLWCGQASALDWGECCRMRKLTNNYK